jgi:mercuric reductase
MKPEPIRLTIEGMTCDQCAVSITKALKKVEGVKDAIVSYASKAAVVDVEPRAKAHELVEAVSSAGRYSARVQDVLAASGAPRTASGSGSAALLIIGGGSAAFAAAIRAADLGASATIVEAATMGGTCVNIGCVPSKTMIRAAERMHGAARNPFAGMSLSARLVDYAATVRQKDGLVAELRKAKYADVLESYPSASYRQGTARFVAGGALTIDGQPVRASKILIATGARPWEPPIPGLADTPHWNSTDALAATSLPAHLVVIGAGAVGIEIAQMMLRMGSKVTMLEALSGVVPNEDADVQGGLAATLREEGMRVEVDVRIARIGRRTGTYEITIEAAGRGETIHADALLVATGRRPNTTALGLTEAGVNTSESGAILVDEHQKTSNPSVYAAGDVTGDPMFVYVSAHEGSVAAENALFGDRVRRDLVGMPRVTFTDPAVASVGMTEAEARKSGAEVIVSKLGLEYVPRAIAARDTRGFVKLVVDAKTRLLLGAHVVAPEAGEMIQETAMAIRHGITVDDIARAMHPFLTHAEGIKLAAQALGKDVSRLSCCAA